MFNDPSTSMLKRTLMTVGAMVGASSLFVLVTTVVLVTVVDHTVGSTSSTSKPTATVAATASSPTPAPKPSTPVKLSAPKGPKDKS